jgi:DNA-binding LytR/AlgR family response regulator
MPEIVLLDDNPGELDKLVNLIGTYYSCRSRDKRPFYGLHCFTAGLAMLEFFEEGGTADIVFLDIIMPGMSGVEVAGYLRERGFAGHIVFLTSANDFAAESYWVGAFAYLLKPVEKESLFGVLQKIGDAMNKLFEEDAASVSVKTKHFRKNILLREIVFVEIIRHNLYIHLANDETVSINKSLKEFSPSLLADNRFVHCHGSIIVNMDFVKTIRDNAAILRTGQSIPISRRYGDFKSRYITYSVSRFKNVP